MEEKSKEILEQDQKDVCDNELVETAVSLEACQYERNFGLTQCGCAT